ncbi:hypothetical protein SAMN05660862_1730 [Sphingobacterium psychroaquaticum]|uniref:Ferric uptake regulator family protein n=1 Tax=Sphingobacterium psychroaquaticum TaxID=561061 RepID=A0A1X7JCJ4_9SPHI|nr:hypothetical protein SAMN05660862_1730 [Sphingobacterium psychroaquaticum]
MYIDFEQLKPIQKAIIQTIIQTNDSLSGDQIFLLLNQVEKKYCYASIFNNLRILKENEIIRCESPSQKKVPNRYKLTEKIKGSIGSGK